MSSEILVDPSRLGAFADGLSGAMPPVCGAVGGSVERAAEAFTFPNDSLRTFADHWDVDIEASGLALSRLQTLLHAVATAYTQADQGLADEINPP
ncbi:MAG: hypothetical protein M3Y77_10785 [Actinomycetota bacterium]|nr:hypothetical protein [Actinomycetota bacterium]